MKTQLHAVLWCANLSCVFIRIVTLLLVLNVSAVCLCCDVAAVSICNARQSNCVCVLENCANYQAVNCSPPSRETSGWILAWERPGGPWPAAVGTGRRPFSLWERECGHTGIRSKVAGVQSTWDRQSGPPGPRAPAVTPTGQTAGPGDGVRSTGPCASTQASGGARPLCRKHVARASDTSRERVIRATP